MKVDDTKALELDSVAYAQAVEAMYGVIIVLKLQPAGKMSHAAWRVYAVAYLEGDEVPTNGALQTGVSYPSRHYKTFGGAALRALYDLEEALRAYFTLKEMRFAPCGMTVFSPDALLILSWKVYTVKW